MPGKVSIQVTPQTTIADLNKFQGHNDAQLRAVKKNGLTTLYLTDSSNVKNTMFNGKRQAKIKLGQQVLKDIVANTIRSSLGDQFNQMESSRITQDLTSQSLNEAMTTAQPGKGQENLSMPVKSATIDQLTYLFSKPLQIAYN